MHVNNIPLLSLKYIIILHIGFSKQGFLITEYDLQPLTGRHSLHHPIPDYIASNFRRILDEEVQRHTDSPRRLTVAESTNL